MVVEERWRPEEDDKRIHDEYLVKYKEEKEHQAREEEQKRRASSRVDKLNYDELLLKYLLLKDYLRDCYPEVWKEFMDETEAKVYQ